LKELKDSVCRIFVFVVDVLLEVVSTVDLLQLQ
jgi:hypothetical protein